MFKPSRYPGGQKTVEKGVKGVKDESLSNLSDSLHYQPGG